ncbi:hypothetical protein YG83_005203, partial [Salmonella enterica subsp. salamae]|nr:hypothetical protein [Salmonella enterica subsp. salamae]
SERCRNPRPLGRGGCQWRGSSRLLRQKNAHLRMQSKTGLLWSRSYFVCSTGGTTIETLRAYV